MFKMPELTFRDVWSFNVEEDSWTIIKPDGKHVITRKPKP